MMMMGRGLLGQGKVVLRLLLDEIEVARVPGGVVVGGGGGGGG